MKPMMVPTAARVNNRGEGEYHWNLLPPIMAPIFPVNRFSQTIHMTATYPHLSKVDGPPICAPTGTGILCMATELSKIVQPAEFNARLVEREKYATKVSNNTGKCKSAIVRELWLMLIVSWRLRKGRERKASSTRIWCCSQNWAVKRAHDNSHQRNT